MKKYLNNFICYVWTHKIAYNDSGCDVCGRCGKHEYYDSDFHNGKPFIKAFFYTKSIHEKIKTKIDVLFFNRLPF